MYACAGGSTSGTLLDQGGFILTALRSNGVKHPSCPTDVPICKESLFTSLVTLAATECVGLYGSISTGKN